MLEVIKDYKGFQIIRLKEPDEFTYYIRNDKFRTLPELDFYLDDGQDAINEDFVKHLKERINDIHKKYTRPFSVKKKTYFHYFGDIPEVNYEGRTPDEAVRFFIIDRCKGTNLNIYKVSVFYSDKRESVFLDIDNSYSLMRWHHKEEKSFDKIIIEGEVKGMEPSEFKVEYDFADKNIKIFTVKETVADSVAEVLGLYELKKYLKEHAHRHYNASHAALPKETL